MSEKRRASADCVGDDCIQMIFEFPNDRSEERGLCTILEPRHMAHPPLHLDVFESVGHAEASPPNFFETFSIASDTLKISFRKRQGKFVIKSYSSQRCLFATPASRRIPTLKATVRSEAFSQFFCTLWTQKGNWGRGTKP